MRSQPIRLGSLPSFNIVTILALLAALVGSALLVVSAFAAGYVVDSLVDNTTDDGLCTLREAIFAANNAAANDDCGPASNANDTITFSGSGTLTLSSRLPSVANQGTLTIDGGDDITISGNNTVGVLRVDAGGATLTIQNITIINGNSGVNGGANESYGKPTVIK